MKTLIALILCAATLAAGQALTVATRGLSLELDAQGRITGGSRPVTGASSLVGCRTVGAVAARKLDGGGCEFVRRVENAGGRAASVTERFVPTGDSIRWELELVSPDEFWTAPVEMRLQFPVTGETRFWTPWIGGDEWNDPLTPLPLADGTLNYGNGKGTICIPVASLLEPAADAGVSLAVSPDQPLLWLQSSTTRDGTVLFRHNLLRFGGGKPVKFVADIVPHEADWRGGLRWMVSRYPEFFNPPNPRADALAGTASYSRRTEPLGAADIERLKKMAYRTDWDASFNWPYFGMFFPPLPAADATWQTYGYDSAGHHDPKLVQPMSYRQLNDKARARRAAGFFTLAYFNITEFGVGIQDPPPARADLPDAESWRDANTFLHRDIADGIYRNERGGTAGTWGGAIAMDSGGPRFQEALLAQARGLRLLPDFDGIVIDRMDWLPNVNYAPGADDHLGWYLGGRPGRFLGWSWNDTLARLGPILHGLNKVILVNCCLKGHRLDYMRHVDGFYDEFGDNGYSLNGSGLLALRKPALMWTHDAGSLKPGPDAYFQRHLHMGAYPTAPFPGNDHTILPDPKTDPFYLDYGPMLDALRGKKWVLAPHCVEATTSGVKVNLFEVPGGYALPVSFGGQAASATVEVRAVPGLAKLKAVALHPGVDAAASVASSAKDSVLTLTVPLVRGCALVKLTP